MLQHSLKAIDASLEQVNPSQIHVLTVDQPLQAKLKLLQCHVKDLTDEDTFFKVLGGLHIEQTAYKAFGHFLLESGWGEAVQNVEIATRGVAESFFEVEPYHSYEKRAFSYSWRALHSPDASM